jgi:uncharacterized membrane-anchored protein
MKAARCVLLGLVLLVQLAVPLQMIRSREAVLERGTAYRFRTEPVDPADPFQGRYVRLDFEADSVPMAEAEAEAVGSRARGYALLGVDADGFARFVGWTLERPATGDYLQTRSLGPARRWNPEREKSESRGLRIDLPFDRFYMEESKAPEAERIAAEASREEDCWAVVRVLDGRAVIEDVLVGGRPLARLAGE